jgi:hypothetical protein
VVPQGLDELFSFVLGGGFQSPLFVILSMRFRDLALGDLMGEICGNLSHPDLRENPNARIHVRQDEVTHMHRLNEYQNTV